MCAGPIKLFNLNGVVWYMGPFMVGVPKKEKKT